MQIPRFGQAILQIVTYRILIQRHSSATWAKRTLLAVVAAVLVLSASGEKTFGIELTQDDQQGTQSAPLTPEALQQLVAPIALYPDALVAQILAASTYPTQIVEADRWVQDHSNLKDDQLAEQVDKQSWDPSIKALTPFASVLANLDTNLSWTSALGDAYFNQQQDVLDAIQVLRARARDAGNLQSTPQENVTNQGPTIIIEPADPEVCYVPTYDPWLVYGDPIGIYPGYIYDSWLGGPYISFGLGIGIGGRFWGGFGWGFRNWGFNWRGHNVIFNRSPYVSNSRTFFHRVPGSNGGFRGGIGRAPLQGNNGPAGIYRGGNQSRAGFQGNDGSRDFNRNRGGVFSGANPNRGGNQGFANSNPGHEYSGTIATPPSMQNRQDYRGFGQPGPNTGMRSGAFSGFGQGGIERGSADRGRASFGVGGIGGGRGFGGGGMRGGVGGRGGGGRH